MEMINTHVVRLSKKIQDDVQKWYDDNQVPAPFRDCHPLVLARASILADGDWTRCVVDDDKSITVYGRPMWKREPTWQAHR